jgi:hypothetical protein
VTTLSEANRLLESQRALLRRKDEREREAALWRDATPEECLAAMFDLCREADHYLARLTPAELERALVPDSLPADTLALLSARAS